MDERQLSVYQYRIPPQKKKYRTRKLCKVIQWLVNPNSETVSANPLTREKCQKNGGVQMWPRFLRRAQSWIQEIIALCHWPQCAASFWNPYWGMHLWTIWPTTACWTKASMDLCLASHAAPTCWSFWRRQPRWLMVDYPLMWSFSILPKHLTKSRGRGFWKNCVLMEWEEGPWTGSELAYRQETTCSPQREVLIMGRSTLWGTPRECTRSNPFPDIHQWSGQCGIAGWHPSQICGWNKTRPYSEYSWGKGCAAAVSGRSVWMGEHLGYGV